MAIPSWLTLSTTGGSGNAQVSMTAATNSSVDSRSTTLQVINTAYGVGADLDVYQSGKTIMSIVFSAVSWVTDIPASGGTANKSNCSYKVICNFKDGTTEDITSSGLLIVSGETTVASSTTATRHSAGTLTLAARYYAKTATTSVTIYQAAAVTDINIGMSLCANTYGIIDYILCESQSVSYPSGTVTVQGGTNHMLDVYILGTHTTEYIYIYANDTGNEIYNVGINGDSVVSIDTNDFSEHPLCESDFGITISIE